MAAVYLGGSTVPVTVDEVYDTEIPHLTHGPHLAHTFRVSTMTTNEAVELYRNRIITRFFIVAL